MRLSLLLALAAVSCAPRPAAKSSSRYPLLNPLLRDPGVEFTEMRPFEYKVQQLVDERKKAGDAKQVAVYFRDLENGPLFGLSMSEPFSPASLMKVPMMMATLKEAEKNPALLSLKVRNDKPVMARSDLDVSPLKRGEEYTVDELLRAMIADSDNDALIMLRTVVPTEALNQVFQDFGFIIPEVRAMDDSMTVREYAAFFRILYNASYLNKESSQRALDYLSKSRFTRALAAGVPPGVVVAHKYGERSFDDVSTKQLHDCGIVYHPDEPYVLCVMTRGEDFDKLAGVIRDVSSLVYREVDAQQKR